MSDRVEFVDRAAIGQMIGRLGEEDLRFLNRIIVDRIRLIHQAKRICLMAQFNVGDRVSFRASDGVDETGVVLRLNQKTVSLKTDSGFHWKISPVFLTAVK